MRAALLSLAAMIAVASHAQSPSPVTTETPKSATELKRPDEPVLTGKKVVEKKIEKKLVKKDRGARRAAKKDQLEKVN